MGLSQKLEPNAHINCFSLHLQVNLLPMPKDINNIHDKFVREAFSDPNRAAASFKTILPEDLVSQLNLDQLSVLKE
jgi:hypothetical protein